MSNTALRADADDDANSEQITVRLPAHLIDALKRKRAAIAKAAPGSAISLSHAVRALLLKGIDADR